MTPEELRNIISEFKPRINTRSLLVWGLILTFISTLFLLKEVKKLRDGHLQFVVCNVGQGDALYLKTPQGLDILVDGGPDNSVLRCLSDHMPFRDRKLELVFSTHAHSDHQNGLIEVKKRYQIGRYFENNLAVGDRITTGDGVSINVLWPPKDFISSDLNQTSLVLKINKFLLTGDSSLSNLSGVTVLSDIEVLKVPHHGSRTALDEEVLKQMPSLKTAVISVGKKNDFGHPAPETISLLEKFSLKIRRTDLEGEIKLSL